MYICGKVCYFVGENVKIQSVTNFHGEYDVTIDAKGRFLLPSGLKKQLPEGSAGTFVINRGFENCLSLYDLERWNILSEKINRLTDFNPKYREFRRLFLNGATHIDLDSAGRLLLPKSLQDHAGIKKDAVLSAQGNKVEIWDKDTYISYITQHSDNFSDLAAEIAKDGIFNPLEGL
jgi:MraZ protein